jgi:hypothetical protein
MRCLLLATEASFGAAAPDSQVEVVVVGISVRWFMQNPGRAHDCLRRTLVARRVSKEASLDLVGAEQPFHTGAVIHDERSHEVPVSRLVEDEHASGQRR